MLAVAGQARGHDVERLAYADIEGRLRVAGPFRAGKLRWRGLRGQCDFVIHMRTGQGLRAREFVRWLLGGAARETGRARAAN